MTDTLYSPTVLLCYSVPLNSLTGEEADRLSGLSRPQDDMMALSESVYQSREHISNILER